MYEQILTQRQVSHMLGIDVLTLDKLVREGKIPEPIKYNRKIIRWKREDIINYMNNNY